MWLLMTSNPRSPRPQKRKRQAACRKRRPLPPHSGAMARPVLWSDIFVPTDPRMRLVEELGPQAGERIHKQAYKELQSTLVQDTYGGVHAVRFARDAYNVRCHCSRGRGRCLQAGSGAEVHHGECRLGAGHGGWGLDASHVTCHGMSCLAHGECRLGAAHRTTMRGTRCT